MATVIFNDLSAKQSGDSTNVTSTNVVSTVVALNVSTDTLNYGPMQASSTSGSLNQTTTVQNEGNASTTLSLSGTALANASNLISTSSQHYATSSFTYGGNEGALSGAVTTVSGFLLTSPTSTANVQSTVYWGIAIPNDSASGTYSGTNLFTASFSS